MTQEKTLWQNPHLVEVNFRLNIPILPMAFLTFAEAKVGSVQQSFSKENDIAQHS